MSRIVDREAMKLFICEGAIECLVDKEKSFSLRNIARTLGKTKGHIQHYYDSVEDIRADTYTLLLKQQRLRLEESQVSDNPVVRLVAGLRAYLPRNEEDVKALQALTLLAASYPERYTEERNERLRKGATLIHESQSCALFINGSYTHMRCLRAYDLLLVYIEGLAHLSVVDPDMYPLKKCKEKLSYLMDCMA